MVAREQPELLALCALLDEPSTSEAQRQQIADAILVLFRQSFSSAFDELFPGLSSPAQRLFLRELAKSAKGRVELTRMLDSDQVAPTLWHDAALQESIRAAGESTLVDRLETYLAKHPVDANARQQTVDARIRFIGERPGDAAAGAELFRQHCAKCHKLGDQGEEIGPQLDGIGQRGLVRIVEDVIDPNRNVDPAFRSTTILTVDGKVVVGLFRRKDGAASVFVDREGKEFRLSQDDIEQQQVTLASLMPDDVAMELPPNKFADLITYLMEQRQKSDDSPPAARQRP